MVVRMGCPGIYNQRLIPYQPWLLVSFMEMSVYRWSDDLRRLFLVGLLLSKYLDLDMAYIAHMSNSF